MAQREIAEYDLRSNKMLLKKQLENLEVKQIRSGFKTSDQVQGQGAGRAGKRSPANGGMSSTFAGGLQRSL